MLPSLRSSRRDEAISPGEASKKMVELIPTSPLQRDQSPSIIFNLLPRGGGGSLVFSWKMYLTFNRQNRTVFTTYIYNLCCLAKLWTFLSPDGSPVGLSPFGTFRLCTVDIHQGGTSLKIRSKAHDKGPVTQGGVRGPDLVVGCISCPLSQLTAEPQGWNWRVGLNTMTLHWWIPVEV